MLKAILFDLDNTLLFFDETEFFKRYLLQIARRFQDIMDFNSFRMRIVSSTQALMNNNGKKSNADYFMDLFSRDFQDRREELWNRFSDFYTTEFDQFETLVTRFDGVKTVLHQLQNKNLKLVIASNPLWPENIQMKRLGWAGLENVSFDLVTHATNMSSCKPSLAYYQEICQKIAKQPKSCMMVGNDPVNDMVAGRLGMKTFLTLDSIEHQGASLAMSNSIRNGLVVNIPEPDYKGSLLKLADIVERLIIETTEKSS